MKPATDTTWFGALPAMLALVAPALSLAGEKMPATNPCIARLVETLATSYPRPTRLVNATDETGEPLPASVSAAEWYLTVSDAHTSQAIANVECETNGAGNVTYFMYRPV